MSGNKYTNGFVLTGDSYEDAEALFNLNGQYKTLSFTVGYIDDARHYDATLNIYLDGIIAYTADLGYDDVAKKITVPLNNALQMKIELVVNNNWDTKYGFFEGKFE